MIRRQPRSSRTDTLLPYTPLFRSILEGGAARFAAKHADDIEIDNMRAILEDSKNGSDPIKSNYDFHQAIYSASHNQFLIKAINNLIDSTALLEIGRAHV